MRSNRLRGSIGVAALLIAGGLNYVCPAQETSLSFPPFDQWKEAVTNGNAGALRGLYGNSPAAQIEGPTGTVDADADVAFWIGLKIQKLKIDVVRSNTPRAGVEQIVMQAEIHSAGSSGRRVLYLSEVQIWQQENEQWRLVVAKRTDPARLQQPLSVDKKIYPLVDGREEIRQALAEAVKKHERVLVVFGADWCYDCHVLDLAFHRADLAAALQGNFEVVHVDVGRGDKNQDLMEQYRVPMKKGIPALAVLESSGKLLFSQQNGEFENARALGPEDLLEFLKKWKPQTR
jgi:thioredoxin 1